MKSGIIELDKNNKSYESAESESSNISDLIDWINVGRDEEINMTLSVWIPTVNPEGQSLQSIDNAADQVMPWATYPTTNEGTIESKEGKRRRKKSSEIRCAEPWHNFSEDMCVRREAVSNPGFDICLNNYQEMKKTDYFPIIR